MNLRRWLRPFGVAVALAVAVLAIRALVGAWRQAATQPVRWEFRPGWLVIATTIAVLTYLVLVESWRRTLHGYGQPTSFRSALRVWILSNFGKYFGSFGIVAGMAMLAQNEGINAPAAVTSAVIMQALSLVTGVALSGLLAADALRGLGPLYSWGAVVIGVSAIAGSGILHSQRALDRVRSLLPSGVPPIRAAGARSLLIGLVGNTLAWLGYGLVMVLLARGLFASPPPALGDATSAYTVSYLVGLLALFVPAGLGLRETIFTALLAPAAGLKVAAALAIASRILLTLVEIGIALPFVVLRRRRGPSSPTDPGR
ncbi:MAG: lysylphosphatidylglycerol synthase domain-containing protein [Gemmatimonadales bacterium]